jgi:predicted MFS family arabinose efflux permease
MMMEGGESATGGSPSRLDLRNVSYRLTWSEGLLLLVLAAVQFTHIVDFVIIMLLGPRMKDQLGLTLDQFNNVVAAYAFSAAVAGLLAAFFMDRFDRKPLLMTLFSGFVVGTSLCALAPNYPMLLLGRVVAGAFGGVGASLTLTIVGDAFPDSRRGTAMGVLMSAFSVASIVGMPLGLVTAQVVGVWQAPFAALAFLGVGVLVLAYSVLPRLPRPAAAPDNGRAAGVLDVVRLYWAVLRRPGHLMAYFFMTSLVLASFTLQPSLTTYVEKNVGVSDNYLEWIYFCGGAASLLPQMYVGRLADRRGKRPVFRVLALAMIPAILLVTNLPGGLAFPWNLAATLLATTYFFVTATGRSVPAMALITGSAEPRLRGAFMSINAAVQQIALALAAKVAGAMMCETPAGTLTGYSTVGWFCAGVTVATVFMVGLVRPAPGGDAAVAEPEPATLTDSMRAAATTEIVLPQPPMATPEAVQASAD